MDNSKSSLGPFPTNGLLAILLLTGGALVLRELPLESTRPAANEPRIDRRYSGQDVDARLWQDPFGAIAREREKHAAKQLSPPDESHSIDKMAGKIEEVAAEVARIQEVESRSAPEPDHEHTDATRHAPKKIVVLAAMLPGGPYAENVESRRRTRYSVLSALNTADYVPSHTEYLGYFAPLLDMAPTNAGAMTAGRPRRTMHASSAELEMPETIPYEWFQQCRSCGSRRARVHHRVLVLWLDATPFDKQPFAKLDKLFRRLQQRLSKAEVQWQVLGPVASDGLRAMVDETLGYTLEKQDRPQRSPRVEVASLQAGRKPTSYSSAPVDYRSTTRENTAPLSVFFKDMDVRFYSSQATVPPKTLLETRDKLHVGQTLATFFDRRGIKFLSTNGDDEMLSKAMVDELKLRGLRDEPLPTPLDKVTRDLRNAYRDMCARDAPQDPKAPHHIALVAEWDTLYGRSLRDHFRIEPTDGTGFCVHRFDYVRGIDGLLPETPGVSQGGAAGTKGPSSGKDDSRGKDGALIERAEGQSQFDYLRRLAEQIRLRDQLLRSSGVEGAGIRAIGVVGTDVHDKLLVLQALQPDFPDAILFSTDLDARLLHPAELGWTRNLIVASNFGLRLTDRLQEGTPPFRSSYQTATFLATRLALDEPWQGESVTQETVHDWFRIPRIFEIGRSRAFDFSSAEVVKADRQARACGSRQVATCPEIHPAGSPRFHPMPDAALALGSTALLLLMWVPARATSRPLKRSMRRHVLRGRTPSARIARRLGMEFLLVAILVILPTYLLVQYWERIATWMTEEGKPISFTEGISTWPTALILLLTLVLSVYLFFRAWGMQARNLDEISLALRLGRTRRQLVAEQLLQDRSLTRWQKLVNIFYCRVPPVFRTSGEDSHASGMTPDTRAFWKFYLVQDRASSRVLRSAVCAMLLIGFATWLYHALGESSGIPVRGELSSWVNHGLVVAAVAMMSLLVSYVGDATFFCVRLVLELRGRRSNWPARTFALFERRLGPIPPTLLDQWIDLQFVAQRTRCVAGLIYYPFIVLSLLLLSRSRLFDDWQVPMSLTLMATLSALIVFACAIALRRVAEGSRKQALRDVDEALLLSHSANPAGSEQLVTLRSQIQELNHGAFAPFSQQPLLKAILLPFATLGGTTLLDYMALVNL